ncbi:DNA cytosine methyltransferase [Lachnobacterium bovis]|uniref:DNA (cytosine-5-)-methyltransferase n=1 Tax=Lachnobacterium bovis TaxID=140626 RepID=A0A1H9SKX6_9FIRM|nr:DNA cytosine methyltransferase [Lachnobacterium bovis]SER85611.1 DNA (cytosine-5)-methyltransferase 1 [Lachnobacterium bovis]
MYTIFETFVGAGGSHLGFKNNGFQSRYVNDFCHEAMETLLINNPEIKDTAIVDETSIVDINPRDILKKSNLKVGELDVLFGGIVCKGFSLAGERSPNDERNYFYHKQLEIVEAVKPKISIIENVPGIQTAEVLSPETPEDIKERVDKVWQDLENYKGEKANLRKTNSLTQEFEEKGKQLRREKEQLLREIKNCGYMKSVYDDILDLYSKLGYVVYAHPVNSACYGAATKRERIIIVAVRDDINIEYEFPEAVCEDASLRKKYPYLYVEGHKYKPVKTVGDALSEIDYSNKDDYDNKPMNHAAKTVARFKLIPEGDNIANHMDSVPDDLKISKFYSRGNTMRLSRYEASPTLVPGHSNFPVHPWEDRSITVREAATITGFPVNYKFIGSHTKRCEEVGNAVPPPLSTAVASKAKELLDKYYSRSNKK